MDGSEERTVKPHEERLFRGHTGRMLGAVAMGNATIALGTLVLAPLLPAIIDDLGISAFQAGIALSVLWGLNALGQFPGGRLSDQFTRKTLLVAGLAGLVTGFLVLLVTPAIVDSGGTAGFVSFLFGAAVVGIGSGLFPSSAYALLSDLFVDQRGRAFGVYTAHWDLGGAFAAGLAIVALSLGAWRAAFVPVVCLAVVVALLVHRWGREPYAVARPRLDLRGTVNRLFGDDTVRLVILAYALYLVTWQGAVSFLPTFLQFERGFDPALASGAFAMLFLIGVVVKPLSGAVGDRIGRSTVALGALVVGAVGLAGIVAAPTQELVLLSIVVFAVGLMAFSPPMLAFVMTLFPHGSAGGDFGGVRTVYLGLGSLGPTYVGFVAGRISYAAAFTGLVLSLIASALVLGWVVRAARR